MRDTATISTSQLRLERIWVLAKTDFVQRYYGSGLGLIWALLNPLLRIIVYYLAFTYLIYRDASADFILYLFLGLMIWQYFSENTNKGLRLLKAKKYLVQNVEINKVDIYLSSALSTSFSFFLNVVVYFIFAAFFDVQYSIRLLTLLPVFVILYLIVVGVSMLLSCVFLYFKDLQHLWDIILLVGMWSLPIFWDYNIILEEYQILLYGNPLTGLLINTRYAMLYDSPIDWMLMGYDLLYALIIVALGLLALEKFSHKAVETQ